MEKVEVAIGVSKDDHNRQKSRIDELVKEVAGLKAALAVEEPRFAMMKEEFQTQMLRFRQNHSSRVMGKKRKSTQKIEKKWMTPAEEPTKKNVRILRPPPRSAKARTMIF
jgi:seryl-tRNA synthetase